MPEPSSSAPSRRSIPWPVWAAAAFVLVFSTAYNILFFDRVPHIHDEACYLFQARMFLDGHLTVPSPCSPESFDFPHMVNDGRWYSMYPPGFPLLLAVGLLVKAPWLVNPLLGAFAILLLFLIGAEVYDRTVGVLAAILGAISIWHLIMSATMMSHSASMAFNALFLLFVFRSLKKPTLINGLAAGLSLGFAYLSRPYNALVFALPFAAFLMWRSLRELKSRWRNALAFGLAVVFAAGAFLLYNAATTGSPFLPGYIVAHGKEYAVIFGRPATLDYEFTPMFASEQILGNLNALNKYLFGWPLSSLWLLLFTLAAVRNRPQEKWKDLLLFSGILSMLIGFFFFWGTFVMLGPRMFYDALPLLLLLSAKGLREAPVILASIVRRPGCAGWRKILAGVLAASTVYAFAVAFPRWVNPSRSGWYYERYGRDMAGASASVHNAVSALELHNAVVIMKFIYAPLTGFPTGWWGSGFAYLTPGLDGDLIYANDRGEAQNLKLLRCHPGRSTYIYIGTLEKGVVLPVREEGGALRYGAPLMPPARARRAAELVDEPQKIFKPYSPESRAFLDEVFGAAGPAGVDVAGLTALGQRALEEKDFKRAALAFECALQIEKNPKPRWNLLTRLVPCYLRTGQRAAALVVQKWLEDPSAFWTIYPERGF